MKLQKLKQNQSGMASKNLIITIVILFLVVTVCFIATIASDNEKKANEARVQSKSLDYRFSFVGYNYTKEDLKAFLEDANYCENYSFSFYESNDLITGKVFQGKFDYNTPDEEIYYDNNTKTYIKISKEDKTFEISNKKLDEQNRNVLANIALAFLNCEELKIKHMKEENYKGFDCVVERFSLKDYGELEGLLANDQIDILKKYQNKGVKISYDFWIEKKTGLIAKYDIVLLTKKDEENRIEYDTNLTISNLTENDIVEPEEEKFEKSGYKIIKE